MNGLENFDWGSSSNWFRQTITDEIFGRRIYEKFFSVDEDDVVMDVGSSIGPFTYSILNKKPKRVYCFEPSTEEFPTLLNNTKNAKVTCINKGISNVDGDIMLPSVYGSENKPMLVQSTTFKNFIEEYNIQKINFLKTDCEGGEYDIFNNENFFWIKENVKKIVGEWHLDTPELNAKFRIFRDTYLRLFPKVEVYSVDGANIKWDLWNEHFIQYYKHILIFIDNR